MKGLKAIWTEEKWPSKEEVKEFGRLFIDEMARVIGKLKILYYMKQIYEKRIK